MRGATEQSYRERMARVVGAIVADPGRPHTVESLAAVAHLSAFHFHRIYRAYCGEALAQTVRRIRLNHAAMLLVSTHRPVHRIAAEVGYDSAQAFSRAFREAYALSPLALRRGFDPTTLPILPRHRPFKPTRLLVETEMLEMPDQRASVLRHLGPATQIAHTHRALALHLCGEGMAASAPHIGISFGDPLDGKGFCYYAGVVLGAQQSPVRGLEVYEVPGGLNALHRLTGPYSQIGPALERLFGTWLPGSRYEPDDRPALELYRNSPLDTPAEALVTDLLIPVKPASPHPCA